jgi:hypothetical protein
MEPELEYSLILFPFLSFKIKRKELLQEDGSTLNSIIELLSMRSR